MFQSLTWLFLTTVSEIKNSVICALCRLFIACVGWDNDLQKV